MVLVYGPLVVVFVVDSYLGVQDNMTLLFHTIDKKHIQYKTKFPEHVPTPQRVLSVMANFKQSGYLEIEENKLLMYHSVLSVEVIP